MSPHIRAALNRISELRAEHRLIIENDYQRAEHDTHGVMLNARGKARGIDPYSLFTHNSTYFNAYASEELKEWRATHPRVTFRDFERAMHDQHIPF